MTPWDSDFFGVHPKSAKRRVKDAASSAKAPKSDEVRVPRGRYSRGKVERFKKGGIVGAPMSCDILVLYGCDVEGCPSSTKELKLEEKVVIGWGPAVASAMVRKDCLSDINALLAKHKMPNGKDTWCGKGKLVESHQMEKKKANKLQQIISRVRVQTCPVTCP